MWVFLGQWLVSSGSSVKVSGFSRSGLTSWLHLYSSEWIKTKTLLLLRRVQCVWELAVAKISLGFHLKWLKIFFFFQIIKNSS